MPTNYKTRAAMAKHMKSKRTSRTTVNSQVARAVRSMTGAGNRRSIVSLPAYLRAHGNMATELKSVDSGNAYIDGGTPLAMNSVASGVGGAVPTLLLQMPVEGSSFYNRIARRSRGVSLNIKGCIKPSLSGTALPAQYGRILIVYDRQANGALPALSAILLSYPEGGSSYTSIQSGLNPDNRDRFVILRDRRFMLPALGANGVAPTTTSPNLITSTGEQDCQLMFQEYIKLKGLETQYKASTSGVIGDIASGSYLIIALVDSAGAGAQQWNLSWDARYSFYD